MKVCVIWDADYPWDVRIEKVCRSLVDAGHEVRLVCRNNARRREYEFCEGVHIHRLPVLTHNGKVNEILSFPVFFSPIWLARIGRVIKKARAEIILVRDLPLALTAISIGRMFSLPVILDMAEDYPELCKDVWKFRGFKVRNMFIRNPMLAKIVEKIALRLVDHIVVISEEFKEEVIKRSAVSNKVSVIMNTPYAKRSVEVSDLVLHRLQEMQGFFKIVYLGLLTKSRGLTTAIKAMPIILTKIPNARLILIGKGNLEGELRIMAKKLHLEEYVLFEGWMDHYAALWYVKSCDIGIMPHHISPFIDVTIPNKLFDYMQMGIPVVTSNARSIMKIMREIDCGEVFNDPDPDGFAQAIFNLVDSEVRRRKGSNGIQAVVRKYNWENQATTLVDVVEEAYRCNVRKMAAMRAS